MTASERWQTAQARLEAAKNELDAALKEHSEARDALLCEIRGCREKLTAREEEVLTLVKKKCSNKEIAAAVNISERTVKFHISNLLAKFGYGDRRHLWD